MQRHKWGMAKITTTQGEYTSTKTLSRDAIETINEICGNMCVDVQSDALGQILAIQVVVCSRHASMDLDKIIFPAGCNRPPPDDISIFADGSFGNPTHQGLSIASAGVWFPNVTSKPTNDHSMHSGGGGMQDKT